VPHGADARRGRGGGKLDHYAIVTTPMSTQEKIKPENGEGDLTKTHAYEVAVFSENSRHPERKGSKLNTPGKEKKPGNIGLREREKNDPIKGNTKIRPPSAISEKEGARGAMMLEENER